MSIKLTKREIEILQQIADGLNSNEIAIRLHISERTVETHRKNIKRKLQCKNFYEVIAHAYKNKILI